MEYRGYNVEGDGKFGYKEVKSIGPGALPQSLKGFFTGHLLAHRAIDVYLSVKEAAVALTKEKADAKPTPIKYKTTKKD